MIIVIIILDDSSGPRLEQPDLPLRHDDDEEGQSSGRLRTNGVNTNGAAAKVMNSDRLGKRVRPGTFGKIKVG